MSSISQIILFKNDKVNYGCSDKLRQSYNYIKSWISSKIAHRPSVYTVSITHNETKEKEFACESLSYEEEEYEEDDEEEDEDEYDGDEEEDEDEEDEEDEEEDEKENVPFAIMKGFTPIYGERTTINNVKINDIIIYYIKKSMTFSVVIGKTPTTIKVCELNCVYNFRMRGAYFYKIDKDNSTTHNTLNLTRTILKLTNVRIL
jgi:hypothetical protein